MHEQRIYLKDVDSINHSQIQFQEIPIKKTDLLAVLIYSDNKEATDLFNQQQVGSSVSGGSSGGGGGIGVSMSSGRGYLVDNNGEIYIHQIGKLKVAGLTKSEVADSIRVKLLPYLQNPYVVVRYANAHYTILGEVSRPGAYELAAERVTIFDAVGLAGDLTIYGRRDNVTVVREERDGTRKVMKVDLRDAGVFKSDAFYIQQNDFVYVEPTRKKPTGSEAVLMRNLAITTSILSTITIIISLVTR
ncbi:polysaccharide biosynthesis/export family protein [Flavihumibacter petaseus]|uniref:Putative polysaccharide export protein n=1 Tax=Flavihumibacter petaseus NBRC 106054 TaxID=1220578 RepID=A0A0E9N7A6_9BACT|nr:polysaccharide biosynthesis/export family protein [Flavihumibacter petaseus]GAO45230.1 putative polysaccharide export protein [Flavihumibacter petaseus NBRC 106054]